MSPHIQPYPKLVYLWTFQIHKSKYSLSSFKHLELGFCHLKSRASPEQGSLLPTYFPMCEFSCSSKFLHTLSNRPFHPFYPFQLIGLVRVLKNKCCIWQPRILNVEPISNFRAGLLHELKYKTKHQQAFWFLNHWNLGNGLGFHHWIINISVYFKVSWWPCYDSQRSKFTWYPSDFDKYL